MTTLLMSKSVNANTKEEAMPRYSVLFDISKNGVLSFTAADNEEATEIYEQLVNENASPDDLEDAEETLEDGRSNYFELRTGQGKLIAE